MDTGMMMMLGTGLQFGAKIAQGQAAQRAADYNAKMLERKAAEERAIAGRKAEERRTEMERVISKQVAGAAASGAGFGPSLLDVIGDTAARGEYQAQGEMYSGEAAARDLKDRAKIARWEGDNAFKGSILEGISGLALGMGRYSNTYGGGSSVTSAGKSMLGPSITAKGVYYY
jgi:hypothetical protein